ncbi:NAD(P)H-quinone oxidoreductase [Georgenia sp. Z1491]|uniref:NAD(P)H-quinone oxidoreductase n=1 Tax=Georgenia sp. Z1491 TaxID=3416707 RepID=UPI003CE68EA7
MDAITVTDDGRLELVDTPDPVPGAGEVLVDVVAAGVNRADLLQVRGGHQPPEGESDVLGLECSGTISVLGDHVEGWQVGDRVCALLAGGGYGTKAVLPVGQLLRVPDSVDLVDAAALPESVCTAWTNMVEQGHLAPSQTVLVHGGSGGVGTIAIQLAHTYGSRVVTTAGGPERTARCIELGADVAVDHRSDDVADQILGATDGRGVDVVLDVLGAGGLELNISVLAERGRIMVIGVLDGATGPIDLGALLARSGTISALKLRTRSRASKAALIDDVRERVWPWVADGRVVPVIAERIPLAEAGRAHEVMAAGGAFGKILLTV